LCNIHSIFKRIVQPVSKFDHLIIANSPASKLGIITITTNSSLSQPITININPIKMHFTILTTTVLALASGTNAWAQAKNGEWIANNRYHKSIEPDSANIRFTVHEACTNRNAPVGLMSFVGPRCRYWINSKGKIGNGCELFFTLSLFLTRSILVQ